VARADSTIRVAILGDASDLKAAAKDSEKATGRISNSAKVAGGIIAGAFALDKVLDFGQSALNEADRLGDATDRLNASLGPLAPTLIATAGGLEDLGQSKQDVLELEARFTDLAKGAHILTENIAPVAQPVVEAAAALAQLGVTEDAATAVDLIAKAAGGSSKPLKELGVDLDENAVKAQALADTGKKSADALTDGELASARLKLIMEQLAPKVDLVTDGEADLEKRQDTLSAKFETFTGQVGDALDGPLTDLLTWLILTADAVGDSVDGFAAFRAQLNKLQGPAEDFRDVIREIFHWMSKLPVGGGVFSLGGTVFGAPGSQTGPVTSGPHAPHPGITLNVQGGSPEVMEQAVRDAFLALSNKGRI